MPPLHLHCVYPNLALNNNPNRLAHGTALHHNSHEPIERCSSNTTGPSLTAAFPSRADRRSVRLARTSGYGVRPANVQRPPSHTIHYSGPDVNHYFWRISILATSYPQSSKCASGRRNTLYCNTKSPFCIHFTSLRPTKHTCQQVLSPLTLFPLRHHLPYSALVLALGPLRNRRPGRKEAR